MPITVSWDNPDHTRVMIQIEGKYTWEELHAAYDQIWSMVRSCPHTVNLINDVGKAANMPSSHAFGHYRKINMQKPGNLGRTAVVGLDGIGRMLSEVFIKAARRQHRVMFVDTVEEARTKLPEVSVTEAAIASVA